MPILRLTLMLSAAIFAAMVIYSERAAPPSDIAVSRNAFDPTTPLLRAEAREALRTEDGRTLEYAARIDPTDRGYAFNQVMYVSTLDGASVETPVTQAAAGVPIVEVTGNRVNFRNGPSTSQGVLGTLTRGAEVELLASLGNGWAHIRTVEGGVEGYMAGRFLSPAN